MTTLNKTAKTLYRIAMSVLFLFLVRAAHKAENYRYRDFYGSKR